MSPCAVARRTKWPRIIVAGTFESVALPYPGSALSRVSATPSGRSANTSSTRMARTIEATPMPGRPDVVIDVIDLETGFPVYDITRWLSSRLSHRTPRDARLRQGDQSLLLFMARRRSRVWAGASPSRHSEHGSGRPVRPWRRLARHGPNEALHLGLVVVIVHAGADERVRSARGSSLPDRSTILASG